METIPGKRPRDVTYDEADVLAVELEEKENKESENQKKQKQQRQLAFFAQLRADLDEARKSVLAEFDRTIQELEGTGQSSPRK